MRDPERIPRVLDAVERLWKRHPDWRLGQLISNASAWDGQASADIEEDDLVASIELHLAAIDQVKKESEIHAGA